jgi:hypothetical protein
MNERIRELSRLAHRAGDSTYAEGPDAIWLRKYEKKFAELIIRECQDNLAWHGHDEAVSQLEWLKVNKLGIKG